MANAHWSQSSGTVKVFGVNALVCIPLLCWIIRPSALWVLAVFFITMLFFIVVENMMKIRLCYVYPGLRYSLMGTVRSPKSNKFDF